ncbi:MAG TPA: response regulator transcription factor [Oculatellaceae cyanobacterium]
MPQSISVVIVEDHEATLKGLKAELSAEDDIEVLGIANCSSTGLKLAEDLSPDVVLLDLHLPDSAGPKTLTQKFCANPKTSVIVFSGDSRTAILNLVLGSGVAGYLLKSEPITKIVESIREVAAGKAPVISKELMQNARPKTTKTEEHLLKMLAKGMKYQDIAAARVVAAETVRKQVDALVEKLRLNSREKLIAWAVENGYGNLDLDQ